MGEVGEAGEFFWSSSELSVLSGNPRDNRLEFDTPAPLSLPRAPYLFFKYLAQELSAAPSFSPTPDVLLLDPRAPVPIV